MLIFWTVSTILFLVIEIVNCGFGIIFLSIASLIISILINTNIIAPNDYTIQLFIFSISILIFAFFFFKNMKKSNDKNNKFEENNIGIILDEDLFKGKEGKIKWSGTISIAMLDPNSKYDVIKIGESAKIKEFKGTVAIVEKI